MPTSRLRNSVATSTLYMIGRGEGRQSLPHLERHRGANDQMLDCSSAEKEFRGWIVYDLKMLYLMNRTKFKPEIMQLVDAD